MPVATFRVLSAGLCQSSSLSVMDGLQNGGLDVDILRPSFTTFELDERPVDMVVSDKL